MFSQRMNITLWLKLFFYKCLLQSNPGNVWPWAIHPPEWTYHSPSCPDICPMFFSFDSYCFLSREYSMSLLFFINNFHHNVSLIEHLRKSIPFLSFLFSSRDWCRVATRCTPPTSSSKINTMTCPTTLETRPYSVDATLMSLSYGWCGEQRWACIGQLNVN